MTPQLWDVDLTDPDDARGADRVAMWRVARRQYPVIRLQSARHGPYWSVSTHDLARQVLEDPARFTSTRGIRLGATQAAVAAAADRMLVVADGAAHSRIRAAHAPWFRPDNVAAIAEVLHHRLDAALAPMVTGEPVDIVPGLADAVPACVMGEMLGTGPEDTARLSRHVREAFAETPEPADAAVHRHRVAASAQVFGYFADLVEHRWAEPGDDVVSTLVHTPRGQARLTDEEILLNCDGLVNGGLGTSRHAVSGVVLAFARHPRQWERLRGDRSLVRSAIEEVLRWASPPMHIMRTATKDTVLGDARIVAGDRVVLWIPSCNRDESVFDDPDEFRIDRRPNHHLSLGAGPHYCIGASAGRMQLRVLLQVLLDRVARIELRGEPVPSTSIFLHGFDRLDVTLMPINHPDGK